EPSISQGRPYGIFKQALQRGNVLAAVAAAKELPQLNLGDALELTVLIARKDPRRYDRIAARWLLRLLEEDPQVTIQEAALAACSLTALPGAGHQEAAPGPSGHVRTGHQAEAQPGRSLGTGAGPWRSSSGPSLRPSPASP